VKARQLRRYGFYATGLAVAWVMLWDRVSAANIVGGLLVAGVLLVIFPLRQVGEDEYVVLHPVAFGRLAASVLGQLVVSNLLVTREVISPSSELLTGIVACPMHTSSPMLLSTVANIWPWRRAPWPSTRQYVPVGPGHPGGQPAGDALRARADADRHW